MKIFAIVLAVILGILLLNGVGMLLNAVLFPVAAIGSGINMPYDILQKTMTGDNAISNYEWFKRQEESIKALNKKEITAQEQFDSYSQLLSKDREKWDREDKIEYSRLQTIVSGLKMQTDDAIAEYNARSNMANRNIFKDNLPVNIKRGIGTSLEYISGGN